MGESAMNEAMLKALVLESNGLIGEQNHRLKASQHLLHEAIMIIKEQEQTINILIEVIEHKDHTMNTLDATVNTLKGIGNRYRQILEAEGIS